MRAKTRLARLLVVLVGIAVLLVGCAACVTALLSTPRPTGSDSEAAEAMADRMLASLHAEAWERTGAVRFRLREGRPLLLWDRARGFVEARFDDGRRAQLSLDDRAVVAWRGEARLDDDDAADAGEDVYRAFANDTFWLAAPFKVRDPGTRRSVVEVEGERQLLVEYGSGGVTPGDAYLWRLDDEGRPVSWRMWVKIIPIGGVEVGWGDWVTTPTGAVLARKRMWNLPGDATVTLSPLDVAATLSELVGHDDPFAPLIEARATRAQN